MSAVQDEIWETLGHLARTTEELAQQSKETDREFKEFSELFTGQWGKLVEALFRPGLLELFRQRGFAVNERIQRDWVKRGGRAMEIDVQGAL